MPETLRSAEKAGLQLPNLIEMRDHGAFAQGLIGVFPTVTFPSHTTMVTGRQPSEHGVFANTLFDPESKTRGAWFYYSESIRVPTLWQAARAAGKKVGAVSWPVTVGAEIDYNIPEYRPARNEDLILLERAISTPGLFAAFEKENGRLTLSTTQDDGFRAAQASYILRTAKPDLMLIHLIDLDHEQHQFGPGSPQAKHALEGIDRAIGVIRKAVETAGNGATTSWLIVSDHGFWPVSQAFQPQALLTSLGLAAPEGKPENWRVAAHSNGGSIAFVSKDPNDDDAQKLVIGALETLQNDARWGIDQVLTRSQLAERKSYPLAFAAVSLSRGFTSGSTHTGPWVTSSGETRGMHGYLPGPAELDTTFLAFGPGIAARQLPRGELADVARTAASLLGISLPSAGGKNLLESGK
jgi:predicted AlkP superfamily pyrophosphatase or phosphodiesterase